MTGESEQCSRGFSYFDLVELELKCCCCGRTLDSFLTPWSIQDVQPQVFWSREPCPSCKLDLATEALLRS